MEGLRRQPCPSMVSRSRPSPLSCSSTPRARSSPRLGTELQRLQLQPLPLPRPQQQHQHFPNQAHRWTSWWMCVCVCVCVCVIHSNLIIFNLCCLRFQALVTSATPSPVVIAPQPSVLKTSTLSPTIACGDAAKVGQLVSSVSTCF